MANHMMIDLETLDTRPTGVVFQVGVICFADVLYGEPKEQLILEEKLFHVDILYQVMNGRTIDSETVNWWKTQNVEAWERDPKDLVLEHDVFNEIAAMMGRNGVGDVWSNSPSFDAVLMRSIEDGLKKKGIQVNEFPSFHNDMDMRTLKRICQRMRFCEFDTTRQTSHNALKDCRDQVDDVVMMLRQIRDIGNVWQEYVDGKLVRPNDKKNLSLPVYETIMVL